VATLNEWFNLRDGRDNFKLKVKEDSRLVLCHNDEIDNQIIGSIERRFAANEPIKMLIYGDWGVGKTHAANHIGWWLAQNGATYPAKTVMIEIGDLERRSKFDVLVRPFLEELGIDWLISLAAKYQQKVGGTAQALKRAGVPDYIASTLSKFNMAEEGTTPPQVVGNAFHILQGRKPGSGWASNGLGLQLTESREFFYVLFAIGEMYRAVNGHRLVFVADEAARLDQVETDDTTLAHWIAVNKDIFDDKNNTFGFIYTLTGKANRLPLAIWDPQIQNRMGNSAFELKNLAPPDVEQFMGSLMKVLVDQDKVNSRIAAGEIVQAEYDGSSYPFTPDAKAGFIDFFKRSQENAKPRDICDRMNELGFIAIKLKSRVIDADCLKKANM
jgi:hypothetical protein